MAHKKELTFIEHLEALRTVLIRSLLALAFGIIPLFFIAPYVINILINIIMHNDAVQLNFFSPLEVFILQIKTALVLDILVCFPYIAKQIWNFILPALYDNERRFIKSIVLISSGLFIIGVLFCLFFIMPLVIRFGMSFVTDNIQAMFGINNVISLALWLSLIFGIMFQFPLITYALLRCNITTYKALKSKRPYIFIGILILSAILTPPDIVSQLMLTVPTYGLFEIGLLLGKKQKS